VFTSLSTHRKSRKKEEIYYKPNMSAYKTKFILRKSNQSHGKYQVFRGIVLSFKISAIAFFFFMLAAGRLFRQPETGKLVV